jgi:3-hydroxyisobutyrate dehydrogenase-like beta-hydroxyacid dehydrogenase
VKKVEHDLLAPYAVHISMSTVSPEMSRRIAEEHAHYSQGYVAAGRIGTVAARRPRHRD